MPALAEQLALAERALRALASGAELPAKIGVHPRPAASWAHAMPAFVPDADGDAASDLLGIKWVSGFPANSGRGLPAIHATLLLFDAASGQPRAILDAGPITAARTAAISGVAIRTLGARERLPHRCVVVRASRARATWRSSRRSWPGVACEPRPGRGAGRRAG